MYVILIVCIIFCYNVICINNNVCESLCVQYKNNTYVANEKVTLTILKYLVILTLIVGNICNKGLSKHFPYIYKVHTNFHTHYYLHK